jgi:hypothetical protein
MEVYWQMSPRYSFTIGGQVFSLTKEEVERKLKNVEPENVRQVYVEINAKKYPIKQALAEAAGLLRSGFTTQDAVRVFRRLSFLLGEA